MAQVDGGLVKSRSRTNCAMIPISLRRLPPLRRPVTVLPPLAKGGLGVIPARPLTEASRALFFSVSSHPPREAIGIGLDFQGSRITPLTPPLPHKEGFFLDLPGRPWAPPQHSRGRYIVTGSLSLWERAGVRGERRDRLPLPREAPRLSRWPWSSVATHSTRAAVGLQSTPHPSPLPRERELVVGSAAAFTLATVSRGDSFDSSGRGAAIDPSPQPSPEGEGASGDENPSF